MWFRRLFTLILSFVVVALGASLTDVLVFSQIILSFVLPFPMIALVILTSRREIMGEFANSRLVTTAAMIAAVPVLALNCFFLL